MARFLKSTAYHEASLQRKEPFWVIGFGFLLVRVCGLSGLWGVGSLGFGGLGFGVGVLWSEGFLGAGFRFWVDLGSDDCFVGCSLSIRRLL